jgi:hypothetical protein
VAAAKNLLGSVVEPDRETQQRQVPPDAALLKLAQDAAAAAAKRATAAVFKGFDGEMEFPVALPEVPEPERCDAEFDQT